MYDRDALAERLSAIELRIAQACQRAGRSRERVTLVAASKGQSFEALQALVELHRSSAYQSPIIFGENYAQELEAKAIALSRVCDPAEYSFHFIGRFQSNKAAIVVRHCSMIHSLCSLKGAIALNREAEKLKRSVPLSALVQVNVSNDPNKDGVSVAQLLSLWNEIRSAAVPLVSLEGCMTILDEHLAGDQIRDAYRRLSHQAASLTARPETESASEAPRPARNAAPNLHQQFQLSMGMSADFDIAVEEGATLIRVGSALFGPRASVTT